MNTVLKLQFFMQKLTKTAVLCLCVAFMTQSISFGGLIREQEGVSASSGLSAQSTDAGYDFVKVTKPSKAVRSELVRPTPQITKTGSEKSTRATDRAAQRTQPVYEKKYIPEVEVASYEPSSEPVFPKRKVIHRPKVESGATEPKDFITRTEQSRDLTLGQQQKKKERYLDALFLRAEAYYEARDYDACMQTLNSIFMFDPYHVKAQRLRKKVDIKASKSRSGDDGSSFLSRVFGNSKHRKQIGVARKLYKEGKYAQAQEVCQHIILEDPYNSKAEHYLRLCKQKLATPIVESVRPAEEINVASDPAPPQPARVAEPVLKDEPAAYRVVPTPEFKSQPELSNKDVSNPPASKDQAQEIALNALLQSMGSDEAGHQASEAIHTMPLAVSPQIEAQREPTMEELAVMARNNLDFNNVDKAQDLLNQMLVKDPESPRAQEVMNDISRWIQEDERAKSDPGAHIDRQKQKTQRTLARAKKAYKARNYDHARSLYQEVLNVDPTNRSARAGIAKTNKKEKGNTLKGYVKSVKTLHEQKRYAEARSLIDQGLALDPTNSRLKRLKAKNKKLSAPVKVKPSSKKEETVMAPKAQEPQVDKPLPKKEKRKKLFSFNSQGKKALTGNEAQVNNLLAEAKTAYKQRHYVESIALYEEVFRLDAGNKKASKGIDRAREKMILQGRDDKTAKRLELENEKKDKIDFYTSMAEKLHQQGKYDAAKIVIHKGLLLDPDDQTLNGLRKDNDIFVKQAGGRSSETEKDTLKVKKNALINKGIKQYLLGDYAEAVKHFNEVLKLDPDDEKARNSIQKIERKQQGLNLSAE